MKRIAFLTCACLGLTLFPSAAAAQQDERRWEIAVFAGGVSGGGAIQGTGTLPPTPAPAVTRLGSLTESTENFPSWYLAGGAAYLNRAELAGFPAIAALDPVLTTGSLQTPGGGNVGVRLTRRMKTRLRADIDVEHRFAQPVLTTSARERIEASRDSFASFFERLGFTSVTSSSSLRARSGGEILTTGSLSVDLRSGGRFIPYLGGGGGVVSRLGASPQIGLHGEYVVDSRFPRPAGVPAASVVQSDNVTVRYTVSDHALVGVIRAGLRVAVASRLSAHVEARGHVREEDLSVSISAAPTTGPTDPQVQVSRSFVFFTSAGTALDLSFHSLPSMPQSLSGPPLADFTTFTSQGIERRFGISAGLGWRF